MWLLAKVTFVCLFALPTLDFTDSTDADGKRPWQWSDEERVAALLDDAAAAHRMENHRARQRENRLTVETSAIELTTGPVDVVDGRRDPQLFFPFELFQQLIKMAYATNANVRLTYRASKNDQRVALGLPEDMWDTLDAIAAAYRTAQFENSRGRHTAADLCRTRHSALIEAQATFGPSFTRFLYSAVAPDVVRQYIRRPDRTILTVAKGDCQ